MNFGLLCDDPAAVDLLAELGRRSDHALTIAVLVSPQTGALLHGLNGVQFTDRWEDLLAADQLDAVIVGGNDPVIWDAARQLAANAVPLVVFPTMAHGPAVIYELSLIRDDRHSVLFPVWRHRWDPGLQQLRDQLQLANDGWPGLEPLRRSPGSSANSGASLPLVGPAPATREDSKPPIHESDRPAISFIKYEQAVPWASGGELPNSLIEEQLFHAADFYRYLAGAADAVTTLQTGGSQTGALIQSVVFSGRGQPEMTWTLQAGEQHAAQLSLHASDGIQRLKWDAAQNCWIDLNQPATPADGNGLLNRVIAAVSEKTSTAEDWSTVLHAAEIVDAAKRSLQRRRTIDLNHEPLSERVIFKSQMAAMGCSVLMLTLGVMLGVLLIDSVAPLNRTVMRGLLLLAAAPMFGFLLFQLLLPLTRTAGHEAERRPS